MTIRYLQAMIVLYIPRKSILIMTSNSLISIAIQLARSVTPFIFIETCRRKNLIKEFRLKASLFLEAMRSYHYYYLCLKASFPVIIARLGMVVSFFHRPIVVIVSSSLGPLISIFLSIHFLYPSLEKLGSFFLDLYHLILCPECTGCTISHSG